MMYQKGNSQSRTARAALLAALCFALASPLTAGEKPGFDPAKTDGHAEPLNADDLPAESHGPAKETQKPPLVDYGSRPLGPPLIGFDLTVLRSGKRVENYRFEFENLGGATMSDKQRFVRLSIALEFGAETGLAETARKKEFLSTLFSEAIGEFTTSELLTVAGKLRLKHSLIALANSQLTTAQVRQIYFTDFRILVMN